MLIKAKKQEEEALKDKFEALKDKFQPFMALLCPPSDVGQNFKRPTLEIV